MVAELDVNRWVRKFRGGRSWNDLGRRQVMASVGLTSFSDLNYFAPYTGWSSNRGVN